jgi:hypothetical protein
MDAMDLEWSFRVLNQTEKMKSLCSHVGHSRMGCVTLNTAAQAIPAKVPSSSLKGYLSGTYHCF